MDTNLVPVEEFLNPSRQSLIPNVKLIESLRHTGYENNAAISDLIDNSIDAEASKIHIFIRTHKQTEILIIDDGRGMSLETLHEALKLGSDVEHDEGSLGKFGMGMITASISMGRSLVVLTRDNSKILKAVMDIDEMIKEKTWDCTIGDPTPEEEKIFNEYVNETGTIIIIRKCDNITDSNLSQWSNSLSKRIGQTFRKLLVSKISIFIGTDLKNCNKVKIRDPLELDFSKTITEEDDFDFEYTNKMGEKIKDKVYLKAAFLDQESHEDGDYRIERGAGGAIGQPNSKCHGCYLLRNNREIVEHTWFNWWTSHAGLNYLRVEICFNSILDEPFNVSFKKDAIDPIQRLRDQLQRIVRGWAKKANEIARARSAKKTQPDIQKNIFEPTEKLIESKANLLELPKADKCVRNFKGRSNLLKGVKPTGTGNPHCGDVHDKKFSDHCKIETHGFGSSGSLFEVEKRGRTVVIKWNSDHPFYQKYIAGAATNEGDLSKAIQLLVFGFANAELTFVNSSNTDGEIRALFENIRTQISTNIKMLLS